MAAQKPKGRLNKQENEGLTQIKNLLLQAATQSRENLIDRLIQEAGQWINDDNLVAQVEEDLKAKNPDSTFRSIDEGVRRIIQQKKGVDDYINDLYIYVQDPMVAKKEQDFGIQPLRLLKEPGLSDGPASARLVVCDFDVDKGVVHQPAVWNEKNGRFESSDQEPLDKDRSGDLQFHQVNAWAVVQYLLNLLESPEVFGRLLPWGFAGNRLIIVPHAGFTPNAYYDRASKSLQFYYLGDPKSPVYNCLSFDVVAHEAGHAVLDGIRPLYYEFTSLQTAAFHEFFADITAMLGCLRNNVLRRATAQETQGDLEVDNVIKNLAEEFGDKVYHNKGLRDLAASKKMSDIHSISTPHDCSLILTGAIFDLLTRIVKNYQTTSLDNLWHGTERILRMALRPVDFLPPVDVQFVDYAQALMRCFEADPAEKESSRYEYYKNSIVEVFKLRGLDLTNIPPTPDLRFTLLEDRRSLSPTLLYHFIHQHRAEFHIPPKQDFQVTDVYQAIQYDRNRVANLCHTVVQYTWSEKVLLNEERSGPLKGNTTGLLCGGTLVFDAEGKLVSWMNKPGCEIPADEEQGEARKLALIDHIAAQVDAGRVGLGEDDEVQITGPWTPSVVAAMRDGIMHLEITRPTLRTLGAENEELRDFSLDTRLF